MNKIHLLCVSLFALSLVQVRAEVKPNALFSDNAVLQQGANVPVWGTAKDGEKITVSIAGEKATTTAKNGKWMVRLKNLKPGGPYTMTLTGENTITLQNLLVGEVWICSGQSNMERQLGLRNGQKPIIDWEKEVASANYPEIREFALPRITSPTPLEQVNANWEICSPQTVAKFSAVGYFFGRDLHLARKVPVGLIHTSWGGTPAESWTRSEAITENPALASVVSFQAKAVADYPQLLAKFQAEEPKLMDAYKAAAAKAAQEGKKAPNKPAPPRDPSHSQNTPSCLYNAMIAPLLPYKIQGVIWYQGESNSGRAKAYQDLFPAMITDWRKQWGQGAFPFLFVQIAPFSKMNPEIREAQLLTLKKAPNTAMAVTTDCGDAADIHPPHKQPVGARLALAARALAYGEKIEYSGPLYESMKSEGDRAVIRFTHTGTGLFAKDGDLKGFTIAGADKKFVAAEAKIAGNTVVVSSPEVKSPVAVRYGWENFPDVNLFNKEGLPASPFRTNDW